MEKDRLLGTTKIAVDNKQEVITIYGRYRDGLLYDYINGGHIVTITYEKLIDAIKDKLGYYNLIRNAYGDYIISQVVFEEEEVKEVSQGEKSLH